MTRRELSKHLQQILDQLDVADAHMSCGCEPCDSLVKALDRIRESVELVKQSEVVL